MGGTYKLYQKLLLTASAVSTTIKILHLGLLAHKMLDSVILSGYYHVDKI